MASTFNCFFFDDTAPTAIYTLSLHDALPISMLARRAATVPRCRARGATGARRPGTARRSEEHTSELQSLTNLVCRLLLEKKKRPIAQRSHRPQTVRER